MRLLSPTRKEDPALVAINDGPNTLAASSIAEAFEIIDILYLTPLINVLDEFYSAVSVHVPGAPEYVSRIFFSVLGEYSRTVTCLTTELPEIQKTGSRTHEMRGSLSEYL